MKQSCDGMCLAHWVWGAAPHWPSIHLEKSVAPLLPSTLSMVDFLGFEGGHTLFIAYSTSIPSFFLAHWPLILFSSAMCPAFGDEPWLIFNLNIATIALDFLAIKARLLTFGGYEIIYIYIPISCDRVFKSLAISWVIRVSFVLMRWILVDPWIASGWGLIARKTLIL